MSSSCFSSVSTADHGKRYRGAGQWVVDGERALALVNGGALVLDVRGAAAFRKARVKGARRVDWMTFSSRGELLRADDELQRRLRALGVSKQRSVVVIGDAANGWGEDGRIVWMLRALGHDKSALLDGGLYAAKKAGLPIATNTPPPPTDGGGSFVVSRKPDLGISTNELSKIVADASLRASAIIVDTRERREFDGQTPYGESRGGHLPGAVHLHYRELLDDLGLLRTKAELLALLNARGIVKDKMVIAYCTGGVRSGWFVVVLRDLGFGKVRNYAGSMWAWADKPPRGHPLER